MIDSRNGYDILATIDELIAEDNWETGYACNNCNSTTFHILVRFGEHKIVCAECGEDIGDLDD